MCRTSPSNVVMRDPNTLRLRRNDPIAPYSRSISSLKSSTFRRGTTGRGGRRNVGRFRDDAPWRCGGSRRRFTLPLGAEDKTPSLGPAAPTGTGTLDSVPAVAIVCCSATGGTWPISTTVVEDVVVEDVN